MTTFRFPAGPPIPGCWFRWGETTYKLAVLPLGGYVQMVGQVDGDESADDDDDPRSFRRKTVGQRMLIISAGVIMNAILAVACFIGVYMWFGRENPSAIISREDSGGSVFQKGVPTDARITKVGTIDNPTFTDLKYTVIFSGRGDMIPFVYQLPGKEPVAIELESRRTRTGDASIGISPPNKLQFAAKRESKDGPYEPGTPAAAAKFEPGDVIVAMTDPNDPKQAKEYRADLISDLPEDPFMKGQRDYFEFTRRLRLLADKPVVLRVKRAGENPKDEAKVVDVPVAPMHRIDLGARMQMGPILVVCIGSPAEKLVQARMPTRSSKAI